MLFIDKNNKNNLQLPINILNEVYFGKSTELIAIQNQLDKFRNKYMGKYVFNMSVNSDPELLKFDRMMEDFFGFGCFTLHVINTLQPNCYTIPVDCRFDYNNNNNIVVTKNGYKFKKEMDYAIIVMATSSIIFNDGFTTDEVFAMLLHEVGHNFNSSINRKNGVLIQIHKAICMLYINNNARI